MDYEESEKRFAQRMVARLLAEHLGVDEDGMVNVLEAEFKKSQRSQVEKLWLEVENSLAPNGFPRSVAINAGVDAIYKRFEELTYDDFVFAIRARCGLPDELQISWQEACYEKYGHAPEVPGLETITFLLDETD